MGSNPGRVMPNTFKTVIMAVLLCAQDCGVNITLTSWCQDKCSGSTGNLPRKHRDITGVRITVQVVQVTYPGNDVI